MSTPTPVRWMRRRLGAWSMISFVVRKVVTKKQSASSGVPFSPMVGFKNRSVTSGGHMSRIIRSMCSLSLSR